MISRPLLVAALACCLPAGGHAQVNEGTTRSSPNKPFTLTTIEHFNFPWKIAFLPDGRLLVTEKPGKLWLVTPGKDKIAGTGVPKVA